VSGACKVGSYLSQQLRDWLQLIVIAPLSGQPASARGSKDGFAAGNDRTLGIR
jgi:hypothetical protein